MTRLRMPGGRDRRRGRGALRTAALVVLTTLPGACGFDVPRPRFPQIEQASEAVQGGGERYRDHRQCVQASTSAAALLRCMDEAHWQFVAHGKVFPEPECWEARDLGEMDRLAPHCFLRAPERP